MAKVYPQTAPSPSSSSLCSETESFTIWMKSLIYHTNGCTVFDSNGDIVYRVDNYDRKCSREVYLMDLRGNVLFTIRKKVSKRKWRFLRFWCWIVEIRRFNPRFLVNFCRNFRFLEDGTGSDGSNRREVRALTFEWGNCTEDWGEINRFVKLAWDSRGFRWCKRTGN